MIVQVRYDRVFDACRVAGQYRLQPRMIAHAIKRLGHQQLRRRIRSQFTVESRHVARHARKRPGRYIHECQPNSGLVAVCLEPHCAQHIVRCRR